MSGTANTFNQRFEKTKQFIMDDDVTISEGFAHLYYWVRFEMAIVKRNKAALKAQKYSRKLNANLDVYSLRKEMSDL